jgi:hypothetical protein
MSRIALKLQCDSLDEGRLQDITRDLAKSLRDLNLGAIEIPESAGTAVTKGVPLDLNSIVMTLIGSGGVAVSLIAVLKAYVERKSTIVFRISRKNGTTLEFSSENLSEGKTQASMNMLEEFLKE